MKPKNVIRPSTLVFAILILWSTAYSQRAQITAKDYERANSVRAKYQGFATNIVESASAIENTPRFWYRKSVKGGNEFVLVDAEKLTKNPAFDHAKVAASLSVATGEKYTNLTLPFSSIGFVDGESAIEFVTGGFKWTCNLSTYECKKGEAVQQSRGNDSPAGEEEPQEFENDIFDGMFYLPPQEFPQRDARGLQIPGDVFRPSTEPKVSPDGKWEALIDNYNVAIRPKGKTDITRLSTDGSEGNYYTLSSIAWSPDSKHIAAYCVRPGFRRLVHYVESSPADQLQPKHWERDYQKPGDTVDLAQPVLFTIDPIKQIVVNDELFPNPYALSNPVWWKDSRAFTFEYNMRGHRIYRVIEVDAATGKARSLISEEPGTFFSYRPLSDSLRNGGNKKWRYDVNDGKEILWLSERDNWNHLYLYDCSTGRVKNQVTKGNWTVRWIDKVDEVKRQIWFQANGMHPGKDPYFSHYFRINFDGTGLTPLTEGDGYHTAAFSSDMKYYIDTWSRVDLAPISQLRRSEDQKVLIELEKGDISMLLAAGWRPPEVFVAKGRDGQTDIWGIITRPTSYDKSKKYPVIENIYAGPQGSFVPKTFDVDLGANPLAELGFIVVQIDGMGTGNRSKSFHDVAWKNIGDAGFPDRILWHKAVAAKYPYYDITRVGIYGGSAGGQNALGGLLFHPEFYKVAVSSAGCHDNRMDKISWNELWMSWPLGPEYAASSNVDNAWKLQGKLLLVVGELDTNVDPSSTLQVVNALIKANRVFDLLVVPGGGHGAGRSGEAAEYGNRKRNDFFVHHLLGVVPPNWNTVETKLK